MNEVHFSFRIICCWLDNSFWMVVAVLWGNINNYPLQELISRVCNVQIFFNKCLFKKKNYALGFSLHRFSNKVMPSLNSTNGLIKMRLYPIVKCQVKMSNDSFLFTPEMIDQKNCTSFSSLCFLLSIDERIPVLIHDKAYPGIYVVTSTSCFKRKLKYLLTLLIKTARSCV